MIPDFVTSMMRISVELQQKAEEEVRAFSSPSCVHFELRVDFTRK